MHQQNEKTLMTNTGKDSGPEIPVAHGRVSNMLEDLMLRAKRKGFSDDECRLMLEEILEFVTSGAVMKQ